MATIADAFEPADRIPARNGVTASFRAGDAWVLVLRGEIDLDGIAPVREQVDRALREQGTPVLFDLSQVAFCDSSTLNLLLHTRQLAAVGLVRPTPWVLRLLDVAGVRDLLPVFDTVDAAVLALAGSGGPARAAREVGEVGEVGREAAARESGPAGAKRRTRGRTGTEPGARPGGEPTDPSRSGAGHRVPEQPGSPENRSAPADPEGAGSDGRRGPGADGRPPLPG